MDGIIVPFPVTAVAERVHVMLSVVLKLHVTPLAVPPVTMSDVSKLEEPTELEKTTV